LRSVYSKVGSNITINPCRDKVTGAFPNCVRRVDDRGNMILSESDKEKLSSGEIYLVAENAKITIHDGIQFDLTKMKDKATWECIKNCSYIAPDRYAKDANGNYLIDGTMGWKNPHPRYGLAEYYIEHPGLDSVRRVKRTELLQKALKYVIDDSREGRVTRAKVLGKKMDNVPDADVTDFLIQIAMKKPDKIITLYEDSKSKMRILLIDAREKNVITLKDSLLWFNDNILGATDDSAVNWLINPDNAKMVGLIMRATYPHLYVKAESTVVTKNTTDTKKTK
jgi:hypothetical protein